MFEILHTLPDPLVRVLTLLAALFPLVLIHELGHFIVAKLNRVRVEEFGIGFPPRAVRLFSAGGTDYTLNWLPIGGFVRLTGEDDPSLPDAFAGKSKRARAAVLLAGPLANFLLAALIFVVVAVPESLPAVQGVSIAGLTTVPGTDLAPAKDAGLLPYDVVVAVDGTALAELASSDGTMATVEALQQASSAHVGQAMTLTVLRGIEAVPLRSAVPGLKTQPTRLLGVQGEEVLAAPEGSPARPGDVLVSARNVAGLAGTEVLALRDVNVVELTVTPIKNEATGQGQMGAQITSAVVPLALPPLPAVARGVTLTAAWMQAMVQGLTDMVLGRQEVALAGPVKISEMSRDVSSQGMDKFLLFMALLSINLGIINLLPIPALDGGRLLFIAAEAVRGKRIEPAREAVVHFVGFVLVIGLMIVLTAVELFQIGSP